MLNNNMKKGIIISGFAGIGKTELGKKYSNIIDLESTSYHWIFNDDTIEKQDYEKKKGINDRVMNPSWPYNYIDCIIDAKSKYDIILITASKEIRLLLEKNDINFIFAFPSIDCKKDIIERYKNRNNNEKFINGALDAFDNWSKELNTYKYPVMIIKKEQYLEDVLKEVGILM